MRTALLLLLGLIATTPAVAQEPESAPAPNPLAKLMEEAKADASRLRGLPFLAELPVRRITKEEFLEITMRDVHRVFGEGEQFDGMERLLHALGVVPRDMGLLDLVKRFFPATVAAKYDPYEREILFLPGFGSKSTMVHELVHALEDQHYNLKLLFEQGEMSFDRLLALGALAEGDAENVQRLFDTRGMLALSPLPMIRQIGEAEIERYLARMKDFPRAIARPFIFQYLGGLLFVETVKRSRGGFAALDAVYRDPPESTEQILHPERYLERDHPTRITLSPPPEGYRLLVENSLGELGTGIALGTGLENGPAVAAGWDGDRIALYEAEGRPDLLCWHTTWDTEQDADRFETAVGRLLEIRHPEAELLGGPETSRLEWFRKDGTGLSTCRRYGRDVLVVEGLPEEGAEEIVRALRPAKLEEVTISRGTFGEGRPR